MGTSKLSLNLCNVCEDYSRETGKCSIHGDVLATDSCFDFIYNKAEQ